MGIFSKLGGGATDVLKGIGKGAEAVGGEALDWGQGLVLGSRSQIVLPERWLGEDDNAYLTRVRATLRDARANLEGRSAGGQLLKALQFGDHPGGTELKLIGKFEAMSPEQQILIAQTGSLDSLTGDTWWERGGILNPILPRPAREIIKGIPVVGEEAERIVTGATSPAGIIASVGLPGGLVVRGVAGSFAGGRAGQALEEMGVDFRTPGPIKMGPRSIGEIAGGLWTGKTAVRKTPGAQLDEIQSLIDDVERAGQLGELSPNTQTVINRMKMSVDNDTVASHNYSARFQGGEVSPTLMEQTMDKVFEEASGTPGGGGAFGNMASGGSGAMLPNQMRWITNRLSRRWMLKEHSADWYALNAHMAMEAAEDGWRHGIAQLKNLEDVAGYSTRMVRTQSGIRQLGEKKGLIKQSELEARTVVGPKSDQPIAGMGKGRNGMEPTVQNIHENPGNWDLTHAQREAMVAYDSFIEGVDKHVRSSLKALGRTPKEIDEYLKKIPTEKGPYFHRLALDREGQVMGATTKNWGAKVNFQKPRSEMTSGFYLDSYTASAHNYAENAMRVLTTETLLKPMAAKMGIKVSEFVPSKFISDLDALKAQRAWLDKAQKLASDANAGRKPQTIARRAAELAQEPNASEELKDLLLPLAHLDDDIIEAARVNIGGKATVARTATQRALSADEKLFKTQQKAYSRLRDAWRAQNKKAVAQGDVARGQTAAGLDALDRAVAKVIKAMKADKAALAKKAVKGAQAATRPRGTTVVALRDLQALMDEVDNVAMPAGVHDAIGDMVKAQGRIAEAGERAAFATGETVAERAPASGTRAAGAANRALAAADEAVGAAETLTRGKVAAGTYRSSAREVMATLKSAGQTNAAGRQLAKNQIQQAKRYIAAGQGFRMLDASKFAGLSAYRFQDDIAKKISEAFGNYEPTTGFIQGVNQYMAFQHALVAGTADMGQLGLHLFSMFRPGTIRMVPRMLQDMLSEEATNRFVRESANRFSMDGTSMYTQAVRANLRNVVEAADPRAVIHNPGVMAKTASEYLRNWWVNQTFSRGIRWARISQFEHNIKLIEASTGAPITAKELRIAAGNAEMITGDFNWTRAGISQKQRTAERTVMRFAPTWVRSQMKLIVSAATLSRGMEAQLARKALAAQLTSYAIMYSGAAALSGMGPMEIAQNLSPMKTDGTVNRDFLTIEVGGIKMGPGGVILSLMRTASRMADLSYKAANGDKEAMNRLLDIRDTGQPLTGFWRAGAPVLTGLMYDIVQGRESYGNRELGADPKQWGNVAMSFIEGYEPFSISAGREEGALSGVTQFFGGRAFPVSAPEKFLDAADKLAKEEGFASWKETPKATRSAIIRGDEALAKLDEERDKFYERFGNDEDKLFDEIDKSQGTMEDALLASYAAVQAGVLSIPDFRQRFSELQREHGYLANSLLDARDDGPERQKDETKQDWYARQYTSIQPEQFDLDEDGVIDEVEWQAWRKARAAFWRDNPEASNFRSYITVDYPARKWKTPEMGAIALERYEALNLYEEFLKIPKYKGLTVDDADFVDRARKAKGRMQLEAQFAGQELKGRAAWRALLSEMGQMSSKEVELFKIAMALDKSRNRDRLLNSQRASFLQENMLLAEWYPSVLADAGIDIEERGQLGFPAPTGVPALELVQQLRGSS